MEGISYTLKIWNSSGLAAEASCTVPFKRNFNLEIDTVRSSDIILDNKYYRVSIYFNDIQGEQNYYRLTCYQVSYNTKTNKFPTAIKMTRTENEFFNDNGRDGMRTNTELGIVGVSKGTDSSFLKIYLLNLDKQYYNYYKSINNYSSGEDPFTEPSPIYTNVKGGLGIFAAYTVDSLIFRLK
jgi:Domain of unknown function (DUF4249)